MLCKLTFYLLTYLQLFSVTEYTFKLSNCTSLFQFSAHLYHSPRRTCEDRCRWSLYMCHVLYQCDQTLELLVGSINKPDYCNYSLLAVLCCLCYCPVWAQERCRISPAHFLAECCMRRLNQASFVLLYFVLFAFFWVVFSFCSVCFWFVSCPVFSSMYQRDWHCIA